MILVYLDVKKIIKYLLSLNINILYDVQIYLVINIESNETVEV